MGNVPYVGFATYHRAIVKIRLYFKRFKKKKKKTPSKMEGYTHQKATVGTK
jgi:hypothetical protein